MPIPANRGPDFEERLRQAMDVDAMIEECKLLKPLIEYSEPRA